MESATSKHSNVAHDHLANERTFLAWVRTGVALVVFGFAIGRFAVPIDEFLRTQGRVSRTGGLSFWFGTIAIAAGVMLTLAGLLRYRRTRSQLESGEFKPAGFIIDLVGIITALFGLVLAAFLIYGELQL